MESCDHLLGEKIVDISNLVQKFADGMAKVDATKPVATNVRSKECYQPGIGPHTEKQTVELVTFTFDQSVSYDLEVPYPESVRSKCDLVIRTPEVWSVEIKMLRFMGDNGKPNDNILMHILSPYREHRSALTDTEKLLRSSLPGRKAILIYGYDYEDWPMDPAIDAFEVLARQKVQLSRRVESSTGPLVHPVHCAGRVFGWEIENAA
jgi:hypothetical protein